MVLPGGGIFSGWQVRGGRFCHEASTIKLGELTTKTRPRRIWSRLLRTVIQVRPSSKSMIAHFRRVGAFRVTANSKNRLILMYLIPTRLLTKQLLPTRVLLSRHPRLAALFLPFTQCIKSGNLKKFDEALAAGEEEFVRRRIYLTLERGREVVLRNLFRKTYMLQTTDLPAKTRVSLELFRAVVEVSSGLGRGEMEAEEVECLLANMIYSVSVQS